MKDHHVVCAGCNTLINTVIHKTVRRGSKLYHASCAKKLKEVVYERKSV